MYSLLSVQKHNERLEKEVWALKIRVLRLEQEALSGSQKVH